jgi:adenylyl-sulfate kinase
MPSAPQPPTHPGLTVWFTGLSAAGKSTLSRAVAAELATLNLRTQVLDSDHLRKHLNRDLGFSPADRDENIRIAYVAGLLTHHGVIVLVAAISPYRAARHAAREHIGAFAEIHVAAPLSVCEARDPIGLYRRVRAGEIHHIAGVDDLYEAPLSPELICQTESETVQQSAAKVVELIRSFLAEKN